jgi:putative polymerase
VETSLATTDLLGRSDRVWAESADLRWIAGALVLGAMTFNAVLCFINTNFAQINNLAVVVSEMIFVGLPILVCYKSISRIYVLLIVQVILYTGTLALIAYNISPHEGLDIKITRDLLIPIVFFILGRNVRDLKTADYIVYVATGLIFVFALFEFFFLEDYLKVFSIAQYYIARGTLEASAWALEVAKGLMVSGIRPPEQGRGLLWFLGDHRVSSLFLEPISLGNFGCMVVLWTVMRSRMEQKIYFWTTVAALALIFLSDTRFGAYFLVVGITILFMPPRITTPAVFVMPFIIMFGLYFLVATADQIKDAPTVEGLSTMDRLFYSGRVLYEFDLYNWLGVKGSRLQTFDAGYAYFISNAGILGLVMFWVLFMSLEGHTSYFYAFRNASAAYFVALFCVSSSQTTIKTASLLWFLIGALSVAKESERFVLTPRVSRS